MSGAGEIARRWIGTPYVHQASARGAGCDCLGLVRGVWRELRGAEPVAVPAYTADWDEAAPDEVLWTAARSLLDQKAISDAAEGDVLLFRMRVGAPAKHLGIASAVGAAPRFVHAYQRHGVVESALTRAWSRRLVARFSF